MSTTAWWTAAEAMAASMYGAALQIDEDKATEEFFRQDADQRQFWVRAAVRGWVWRDEQVQAEPPGMSQAQHEILMQQMRATVEAPLREEIAALEQAIVTLALALSKPAAARVPIIGKVS